MFILFTDQICLAQESEVPKIWHISIGADGSRVQIIENTFSSIPFSGNQLGAVVALACKKKYSFHELQLYYGEGLLSIPDQHAFEINQWNYSMDYTYLHEINYEKNSYLSYKAGGSVNVFYANREYEQFINNNRSFEFIASLSGVAELGHSFPKGFFISNRILIPFISSVVQPAFGSENSSGNINGDRSGLKSYSNSNRIMSFGSFFRCRNDLRVTKDIFSNQSLAIGYSWDYYQIQDAREIKSANHHLILTFTVKL